MSDRNNLKIEISTEIRDPAETVAVCVFADEPRVEVATDGKLQEFAEGLARDGVV